LSIIRIDSFGFTVIGRVLNVRTEKRRTWVGAGVQRSSAMPEGAEKALSPARAGDWSALGRAPWLVGGYALFGLGLAGMALPVLPTTVFWIGAALCFARSSPRMYQRLLDWPGVGPAIDAFLRHGAIPPAGKACAVSGMAVGGVIVALVQPGPIGLTAAAIVLSASAAYVLTRPNAAPARR